MKYGASQPEQCKYVFSIVKRAGRGMADSEEEEKLKIIHHSKITK